MKKIYLIDGNSFIYRMFFALPEFSTKEGKVVNALFWMAKFFVWQLVKEKPDYVVFIKDAKGDNFRHTLYADYKATRERMPDSLRSQIADIEEMIGLMNIPIIEIEGFEADDVIATLAKRLERESNMEIYILSGDKDLYALVSEQVKIYDTQKKKISGREDTFEKFWVYPEHVRDYLAICGDTSDNIPGISWFWPKKAQTLLNEFGSLDAVYNLLEAPQKEISPEAKKIFQGKTAETLKEQKEIAFLSQKLATLCEDVPLPNFALENHLFITDNLTTPSVLVFFEVNEFHSLLSERQVKTQNWDSLWLKVQIIGDDQWLNDLLESISKRKIQELVLDTETTSLNVFEAKLVWVSLCISPEEIYYINLWHAGPKVSHESLKLFLTHLQNSEITLIGHNLKYDFQIISQFLSHTSTWKWESSSEIFWQTQLSL